MNERIEKLIQQVETDTSGKWIRIDNAEKLVELVVKDCAELIATRDARVEPAPHIFLVKEFGL